MAGWIVLVSILAQHAEKVARATYEQEQREIFFSQKVAAGNSIRGIYPPERGALAEYEAWRKSQDWHWRNEMEPRLEQIQALGVVPVVAIENATDAPQLGRALVAGGLPCAEITFRTAAAPEAIRLMAAECPDVLVGAGTVLTVVQAETAVANGAKFIVTPGFDDAVVDWCIANQVPVTPGVMTPTEINLALNKGLNVLKFFPAEAAGGVKTLTAVGGPYGDVKFVPTGGISPNNLRDYLSLPSVLACGGSWLVKKPLISGGEFETIMRLAQEAVAIVKEVRE